MEISFLFKIAGIGLIVIIMQQILSRAGREEFATLTVLTGIIIIVIMLIPQITSVVDELSSILNL
ncbi:MAG: stage III sporulation protein AC [Clostridia bacterium]|nr:stage III sporulation protein AC [Clostridia bacterium]